jgi:hypothetical protein
MRCMHMVLHPPQWSCTLTTEPCPPRRCRVETSPYLAISVLHLQHRHLISNRRHHLVIPVDHTPNQQGMERSKLPSESDHHNQVGLDPGAASRADGHRTLSFLWGTSHT